MDESNALGLTPGFGDKLRGQPIPPWVITETIDGQVYYIGGRNNISVPNMT